MGRELIRRMRLPTRSNATEDVPMRQVWSLALIAAATWLAALLPAPPAIAQSTPLAQKINPYIECMNRQSGRAYQARERYLSWVGKDGPTGRERIVYGTYTIYDTADCAKGIPQGNALEPRDAALEAAATDYLTSVTTLAPLLKEADDYYTQQNYKDDKMAKGKALHPRLLSAFASFANADEKLSGVIDAIQEKLSVERLSTIERTEGKKGRWHVEALMIEAKRLIKVESASPPELAKITPALAAYEASVKAIEDYVAADPGSKIGSSFIGSAKTYLTTAKNLMRRIRDKVPYNQGEKMIMSSPGGAWMVEGSPARLTRDYNALIEAYNRGARI
jgi:hypothetical protein